MEISREKFCSLTYREISKYLNNKFNHNFDAILHRHSIPDISFQPQFSFDRFNEIMGCSALPSDERFYSKSLNGIFPDDKKKYKEMIYDVLLSKHNQELLENNEIRKNDLIGKYGFIQSRIYENKAGFDKITEKQCLFIASLIDSDINLEAIYLEIMEMYKLLDMPSNLPDLLKSQGMFLIDKIVTKRENILLGKYARKSCKY